MKKLLSWNVNGLRACMQKGFMDFFDKENADIFCIQEIKLQEGQIDWDREGYYAYWNYAEKKGYSGTAVFTKEKAVNAVVGLLYCREQGTGCRPAPQPGKIGDSGVRKVGGRRCHAETFRF